MIIKVDQDHVSSIRNRNWIRISKSILETKKSDVLGIGGYCRILTWIRQLESDEFPPVVTFLRIVNRSTLAKDLEHLTQRRCCTFFIIIFTNIRIMVKSTSFNW